MVSQPSPIAVVMQVYRWANEQAGPDMSGFEIDLAWLDALEDAMKLAHEHAESAEQALRSEQAVEAARALRRAIKNYEAVPGARSQR